MKCPHCGAENPDRARYCRKCDMPLYDDSSFWTYKNKENIISRPQSEDELIALYENGDITRNTLLRKEDSDQWQRFVDTEMFLRAKEPIAQKKPAKYKKPMLWILAVLIALCGAGAAINFYANQPSEKLVQPVFNLKKEKVIDSMTENGWSLDEECKLPDFQEIPIPVSDHGYIVKVDGKYGIMDTEGQYIVKPSYTRIGCPLDTVESIVFYKNPEDKKGDSLSYLLGLSQENTVSKKEKYPHITVTSSRNAIIPKGVKREDITTPITLSLDDFWYELVNGGQKYYIWNPKNDKVFGPFNTDNVVFFTLKTNIGDTSDPVPGLFYVSRDGKCTVYKDGGTTKTIQTFDWAEPISDRYMLVSNNDQIACLDYSLKATFIGKVDNATAPVMGVSFVKFDDKWQRIYNVALQDKYEKEKEEKEAAEKEAEEKANEEAKEKEKEKNTKVYRTNNNMYIRTSPGGAMVSVAYAGTELNIVSTEERDDGTLWGELDDGNWICISSGSYQYCTLISDNSEEESDEDNSEENSDEDDSEENEEDDE